jgi:putative nucleotidyltransferase with HDIG domain
MGRPVEDIDIVVPEGAEGAARELARFCGGHVFPLSERFGAWRVIARDRSWQADVTPVRGDGLEADLALRDFTVNAMALPLGREGPLLDPFAGSTDIAARVLRVVGERSYRDDPLRTLRMPRLACELGFEVEHETGRLAAESASEIHRSAAERVFYELRRLISCDGVMRGLELMDEAGLVAQVLPELEALKGVEQNPYHHLDVWGHTLSVLEELVALERDLERVFGDGADAVRAELERPLADGLSRREALRLGALLHDAGKPGTRRVMNERVMFIGHDELGATIATNVCRRLHASADLAAFVAALARHHLRLGFLVHERPVSRRQVYGYLRVCEPVELEVTVLSVADRLATRGARTRDEAIQSHLELARELAAEAVSWRRGDAPPLPVNGDDLMQELGLEPGPRVGELLERLREAAFAGEVRSREDALRLARAAPRG